MKLDFRLNICSPHLERDGRSWELHRVSWFGRVLSIVHPFPSDGVYWYVVQIYPFLHSQSSTNSLICSLVVIGLSIRIQTSCCSSCLTLRLLLLASMYRCDAMSLRACPCRHLSLQNSALPPSPRVIEVDAWKSAMSLDPQGREGPRHASNCQFCCCHITEELIIFFFSWAGT